MTAQPMMNVHNVAAFWKERLEEIRPHHTFTGSVPTKVAVDQLSGLYVPLVEQAVRITLIPGGSTAQLPPISLGQPVC